jgi:hypothetical protein
VAGLGRDVGSTIMYCSSLNLAISTLLKDVKRLEAVGLLDIDDMIAILRVVSES